MSEIYSGTFQPRMVVDGKPLRHELRALIGKRFVMRSVWTQADDDKYPGEMALMPADKGSIDEFNKVRFFGWIASGDFSGLTEIGGKA